LAEKIPFQSGVEIDGDSIVHGAITVDSVQTQGNVDGVDVSQFKSDYDVHNHDGRYADQDEFVEHNHDSAYLSSAGGQVAGNLDVEGKIYDKDKNNLNRDVSATLDLLLKMLPATFDPLSVGTIVSSQYLGRIANGTGQGYTYDGHVVGGDYSNIVFGNVNKHVGGNIEFASANTGSLQLIVNESVMTTVYMSDYSPDGTPGTNPPSSGYPASGIRISVLEKHSNFFETPWFDIPAGYTRGEANITVTTTNMRYGSNTIRIEHRADDNSLIGYAESIVFYDVYTTVVSIVNQTLTMQSASNTRYLSGVPYAGSGTSLSVSFRASYFFGGSYPAVDAFHITNSALGITEDLLYSEGSGYSTPNPVPGEYVNISRTVTTSRSSKYYVSDAGLTLDVDSNNPARNANAVTVNSTTPIRFMFGSSTANGTSEDHYGETYRIPAAQLDTYKASLMTSLPQNQFSSNVVLAVGELQIMPGYLIYPVSNYVNTSPTGPDYSSYTGDRVYGRAFNGFSPAEAGGKITIQGITASDISTGRVKVELCIPGVTGWGDLGLEYFNPVDDDGDGCWYRAAGDGTNGLFGFFFGYNFANGGSANAILVRITIFESAQNDVTIGNISVSTLY